MPENTRPEAKELADLLWEDIQALPEKEKLKVDAIIRLYCNESLTQIRKVIKAEIGIKLDDLQETANANRRNIESINDKAFGNGSSKV